LPICSQQKTSDQFNPPDPLPTTPFTNYSYRPFSSWAWRCWVCVCVVVCVAVCMCVYVRWCDVFLCVGWWVCWCVCVSACMCVFRDNFVNMSINQTLHSAL